MILYPLRGGDPRASGPKRFENDLRYRKQVPDFIALRGDPSDKLPEPPGRAVTRCAFLRR